MAEWFAKWQPVQNSQNAFDLRQHPANVVQSVLNGVASMKVLVTPGALGYPPLHVKFVFALGMGAEVELPSAAR